jgi:3-oxoacyl-[acyl-carrier-protein] synthase-3
MPDGVRIGSFARDFGEVEAKPEQISGFDERWAEVAAGSSFAMMGCETFRKMDAPVVDHLVRCLHRSLELAGVDPAHVDHLVLSTKELCLPAVDGAFVTDVLDRVGLVNCTPLLLTLQRCSVSHTALRYATGLFADPTVTHVAFASFDVTADDLDRIRSFAIFGDAVTSCVLDRGTGGLDLLATGLSVDYEGLFGRDTFATRQDVAARALGQVAERSGVELAGARAVFPTNMFKPLTMFSAAAAGLDVGRLHYADNLAAYGHCGDCDWMINLGHYAETVGMEPGETYIALASAPGFFAGAQLRAR